ncbi:MAG TPA: glycosyltransferase [Syntrophomonadaceae bacterium]|nr:glycosyltransferase [Syntrophomonadaceae bacterium]HPR93256.1 glycosyltransferase [Syntrophomonadaceae bacterium]
MKILFTNDAPVIKRGIGKAFADFGVDVCYTQIVHDPNWINIFEEFKPDYVFNDGGWDTYGILFPFLTERNIPHIFWAIEDPIFYQLLSLPHALKSEFVFTTCQETIAQYQANGVEAYLLPFACHPDFHKRAAPDPRFNHDIVFVGNNYFEFKERIAAAERILKPLMDANFNIKIYGNEWWLDQSRPFSIDPRFYGGYLGSEDLPAVCASVPIVLGLHSVTNSSTMMSMRTFEILGSGGFYLTQWTPAIENMFRNHYHLVWSNSAEETLDLVNYYLAHPELREKIALQGQREVYEKHTYHKRIEQFLPMLTERLYGPLVAPTIQNPRGIRFGNRFKKIAFKYSGIKTVALIRSHGSNFRVASESANKMNIRVGRRSVRINHHI